jgi:hypothetical protein
MSASKHERLGDKRMIKLGRRLASEMRQAWLLKLGFKLGMLLTTEMRWTWLLKRVMKGRSHKLTRIAHKCRLPTRLRLKEGFRVHSL